MTIKRGGDVPDDIREHLPEALSDLPSDLIYATNLSAHEFMRSAPRRRSLEERREVMEQFRSLWGISAHWPGWAVDVARRYHEEWERLVKKQEDAVTWVRENRCPE